MKPKPRRRSGLSLREPGNDEEIRMLARRHLAADLCAQLVDQLEAL
jgi:hypothetical protein